MVCDKCEYQHFSITRILGLFECSEPNNIYGWSSGGGILFTHKDPDEIRVNENECKKYKEKK
jgi:hypothetical protein